MPQIWSDNTLNRLAQLVEEDYTSKLDVVIDRYALPIVHNQYDYTLPDYIKSIRRVAWRGYELNPRTRMDQIRSSTTPFATTQSQPREYLVTGMGYLVLRLLPAPNIDLSVSPTADLWDPVIYFEACVLEFSRVPDLTDESLRIPEFLRRVCFKDAILGKALSQEGQGQDLKGSTYFANKSKLMLELLIKVKSNLWLYCPRVMSPDPSRTPRINHPVLPPNFPARY